MRDFYDRQPDRDPVATAWTHIHWYAGRGSTFAHELAACHVLRVTEILGVMHMDLE